MSHLDTTMVEVAARKSPRKKAAKKSPSKAISKTTRDKISKAVKKAHVTGRKKDGKKADYEKAKPSRKKPRKISDFGAKIGGARKDRVAHKRKEKEGDTAGGSGPPSKRSPTKTWKERIGVDIREVGKDADTRYYLTFKKGKKTFIDYGNKFDSREAATKGMPLLALRVLNYGIIKSPGEGDQNKFHITRRVGRRNDIIMADKSFSSLTEAHVYMRENAENILNYKVSSEDKKKSGSGGYGEDILTSKDAVVRVGPSWRKLKDATPDMVLRDFGFHGVEFGNWQGKRSDLLNMAYDGLRDMANVLGISPLGISLGGKLSLAFGARGKGGRGAARAHFEPTHNVINLTKEGGAGSLAHEWAHGLDYALLIHLGTRFPALVRATPADTAMLSSRLNSGVGHECLEAVRSGKAETIDKLAQHYGTDVDSVRLAGSVYSVVSGLMQQAKTIKPDEAALAAAVNLRENELNKHVDSLVANLVAGSVRGARKKAAVALSPGDADRVKALASGFFSESGSKITWANGRWSNETVHNIDSYLRRKGVGSLLGSNSRPGPVGGLLYFSKKLNESYIAQRESKEKGEHVKVVDSDFSKEAVVADSTRSSKYWSLPHEMLARAFSAYVEDELKSRGEQSDYLSRRSDNEYYKSAKIRPFADGEERVNMSRELHGLMTTLRQSGFFKEATPVKAKPVRKSPNKNTKKTPTGKKAK